MKEKIRYAFYLLLPIIGGSIIGFLTSSYIDYDSLTKPFLSPPSWLFPVMWSIIYVLLGISYFLFRKNTYDEDTVLIYYIQLIVNYLWSIIFFVFKFRLLAIFWILLLDVLVIMLMININKYNKKSTYLLVPYIIWNIFATYLTVGIFLLN